MGLVRKGQALSSLERMQSYQRITSAAESAKLSLKKFGNL